VLLGFIANLSAANSEVALAVERGIQIALAEYNSKSDSIYEVRLRKADTKGTPEGTGQASANLVKTERLIGVLGPLSETESRLAGGVFEDAEIPYLSPNISATTIPSQGARSFRRLVANDRSEGQLLARLAAKRAGGALAVFHDGGPEGSLIATVTKETLDQDKRPAQRFESVGPKGDLKSLIDALMSDPPKGVVYAGSPGRGAQLIGGLRKAGYQGAAVVSHHMREPKQFAPEMAGTFTASPLADPTHKDLANFAAIYQGRFDSPLPALSVEAYEGATMLLEAIQEVEPKPKTLSQFFRLNRSFLGESKVYTYDENGELIGPPFWVYEMKGTSWRLTGRSDQLRLELKETKPVS